MCILSGYMSLHAQNELAIGLIFKELSLFQNEESSSGKVHKYESFT